MTAARDRRRAAPSSRSSARRAEGVRAAGWASRRDVIYAGGRPRGPSRRTGRRAERADDRLRRPTRPSRASASPLLVEAFARVRRERPGARLLLVRPRDPPSRRASRDAPGVDLSTSTTARRCAAAYRAGLGRRRCPLRRGLRARARRGAGLRHAGRRRAATAACREIVDRDGGRAALRRRRPARRSRARCSRRSSWPSDPATAAACRARAEHFSRARCVDQYQSLYRDIGAAQ